MTETKPEVPRLGLKKRPLVLGRSTNVLWTILPTIAVVAALFVGFSYISYFLREVLAKDEVTIRDIDGVVPAPKPLVEQTPPISPEEAVEAYWLRIEAEKKAAGLIPPEPVLEEEIVEPAEIELKPLETPALPIPGLDQTKDL